MNGGSDLRMITNVIGNHGEIIISEVDGFVEVGSHIVMHGDGGGTNDAFLFEFIHDFPNAFVFQHFGNGDAVWAKENIKIVGVGLVERVDDKFVHVGFNFGFPTIEAAVFLIDNVAEAGAFDFFGLVFEVGKVISSS